MFAAIIATQTLAYTARLAVASGIMGPNPIRPQERAMHSKRSSAFFVARRDMIVVKASTPEDEVVVQIHLSPPNSQENYGRCTSAIGRDNAEGKNGPHKQGRTSDG